MIAGSRVRSPAGAAEEFSSPGSDFCADSLFLYPSLPRVAAVTRKRSRPFCQKCRWQVTAMHAYIHLLSVNGNIHIVKKLSACIKQEQKRHSGGMFYCQGTGFSEVAGRMTIAVGYIPPKHRTPSTFKTAEGCSLTSITYLPPVKKEWLWTKARFLNKDKPKQNKTEQLFSVQFSLHSTSDSGDPN